MLGSLKWTSSFGDSQVNVHASRGLFFSPFRGSWPSSFPRWHLDEGRRWGFITTLGQVPCPVGLCWAQHRTPSLPCHWRSWHAASPVFWCLWWHVLLKSGVLPSLHWSAFLKSHEDSLLLWSLSALSCFALYLGIWKLLVAFFPVCWNIQESPAPFCKKKKKNHSLTTRELSSLKLLEFDSWVSQEAL